MSKGEWLVLTRTRSMLDELEDVIYKNGLYYKNKFKKSYEQDLYDAINDWEHLRQGQLLNYKQIEKIYTYMSKNHVEKNKLKIMIKDAFFGIDQLTNQYGLKTVPHFVWLYDERARVFGRPYPINMAGWVVCKIIGERWF